MSLELPQFNYHLFPLESGSIEPSEQTCLCCNKKQGYIYVGPVMGDEDLLDKLCPWCIQNGSARKKFKVEFTSPREISDFKTKTEVPDCIIDEICYRTPGFYGWQESKWWMHCGDGARFLGTVGGAEIEELGSKAIASLRSFFPEKSPEEFLEFLGSLSSENSPSAYLFQCRRCAEYGVYADEEELP